MINVHHFVYDGMRAAPFEADEILERKFQKFQEEYGVKYFNYTIGVDYSTGIVAIAIPHPIDGFDPEIGWDIVTGRIRRMRGEIRTIYDPIPSFILKSGVSKGKENEYGGDDIFS